MAEFLAVPWATVLPFAAIIIVYVGEKLQQWAMIRALKEVALKPLPGAGQGPVAGAAPSPSPPTKTEPAPAPAKPAPTQEPRGPFDDAPAWFKGALHEIGFHETGNNGGLDRYIGLAHCGQNGDPWCFTGDTEIMTERGWVRFDRLANERVYQADDSGALSLIAPEKVEKDYDGDAFDISHRSIRLTCDAGHRWYGSWGQDKPPKFGTLDQITTYGLSIPAVRSGAPDASISDRDLRLLAAFMADGCLHDGRIQVEVSRPRKLDALRALNPSHVYEQKRTYGPLTKRPLSQFYFEMPQWFDAAFDNYKRLKYEFITQLSAAQAATFLESYATFDGNGAWSNHVKLYTGSLEIRDALVTIATLAGFHINIHERTTRSFGKDRLSWMLTFSPEKANRLLTPEHVSRSHFTGKMYCVRVPHQRIVVRGTNGVPVLTGNCAIFANAMLEQAGIPGTRSAASQSFRTHPNFVQLSGPALGAVAVFWRGSQSSGLGHVGFYRGEDASRVWTLGGNENDMVQIEALPKSSGGFGLIGYFWPMSVPLPAIAPVMMPAGSPASIKTDPSGQPASAASAAQGVFTDIVATMFTGQQSAYGGAIKDDAYGVALPFHFPAGERPKVRVTGKKSGKSIECEIVDVGPWNTRDPYWETASRPQAESGTDLTGRHTNKAGIDLTMAAAEALQIDGKGLVDWEFVQSPAPEPKVS